MTVKVINTMQPFKLLYFILIVLVPISSLNLNSEQQEESSLCPEGEIDMGFGMCIKPEGNFTIPPPRETTTTECETTDDGKEKCVKKTIINGTFSFKECNEKGQCTTIVKKDEKVTTDKSENTFPEFSFPKLW
jgi:hypothetical protein